MISLYRGDGNRLDNFVSNLNHCNEGLVSETLNGSYTINIKTDINDIAARSLISGRIIKAKPNPYQDPQFFIIEKTCRKTDGSIEITGKHIHNLAFAVTKYKCGILSGTPKNLFNNLNIELPYNMTFESNVTKTATLDFGETTLISLSDFFNRSNGDSLLTKFAGEYEYDNLVIRYLNARGSKQSYTIRYGKNISSATQQESIEELYTHVVPYGTIDHWYKDDDGNYFCCQEDITTDEPISIPNSESNYKRIAYIDCNLVTKNRTIPVGATANAISSIQAAMTNYALNIARQRMYDKRKVSITIDNIAELDQMQNFRLGDTVTIELDNFGTKAEAKICQADYDIINDRYVKLTVGSPKILLSDILTGGF